VEEWKIWRLTEAYGGVLEREKLRMVGQVEGVKIEEGKREKKYSWAGDGYYKDDGLPSPWLAKAYGSSDTSP